MKTVAFLANNAWCCILVERNGNETQLFQTSSIEETYQKLDAIGLFPQYPVEFWANNKEVIMN